MQDDKEKRKKKAQEEMARILKSAPTESSKKRDYPLSPTPKIKMDINPLNGKVYVNGKPISSLKKYKQE